VARVVARDDLVAVRTKLHCERLAVRTAVDPPFARPGPINTDVGLVIAVKIERGFYRRRDRCSGHCGRRDDPITTRCGVAVGFISGRVKSNGTDIRRRRRPLECPLRSLRLTSERSLLCVLDVVATLT